MTNHGQGRVSLRSRLAERDDAALVAIARRQLPHVTVAYEVLMRRYQDRLMRSCLRYLGNEADAEELVHEIMLKVFHGLSGFKGESGFRTWLFRIAHNESMSALRKRRYHDNVDDVEETLSHEEGDHVEQQVMALRVNRWLHKLDEEDRSIVVFRVIAELEYKEIAEIVDMKLSAVKMRFARAMEKLKQFYDVPD